MTLALALIFNTGDKVYNIITKKTATVVNLRDDQYEKKMREKDPTHYYYHLNYDDDTFDTYVPGQYLIKDYINCDKIGLKIEHGICYIFEPGQRFRNIITN